MSDAPKKPSRQQTLARLEAVSDETVGTKTPLDAAFGAFESVDPNDAVAIAQAQAAVRDLLAIAPAPKTAQMPPDADFDDTSGLGKHKLS